MVGEDAPYMIHNKVPYIVDKEGHIHYATNYIIKQLSKRKLGYRPPSIYKNKIVMQDT